MHRILPGLRAILFALAALSSGLITGCGLKGDLVLPEQTDTASEPESESDSEDEDENQARNPTEPQR